MIYNPAAGAQRGGLLDAVLEALGSGVEPTATARPGDATDLAREAAAAGTERVYALGGDGTAREVAAGLLGSTTSLGILPAGTTNVVAGALGLRRYRPVEAARRLAGGSSLQIDVGRCGEEVFLMQVSSGLDAAVMASVPPFLKRHGGRAGVVLTAFRSWWTYGYPELRLEADGESLRGATFAAVCNLAAYAGAFRLAPEASCRDGELDLVIFRGRGRLAQLGFARDLVLGRHPRRADIELRRVREVEIGAGAPLQVDGDVIRMERTTKVHLDDRRLRLLTPSDGLPSNL